MFKDIRSFIRRLHSSNVSHTFKLTKNNDGALLYLSTRVVCHVTCVFRSPPSSSLSLRNSAYFPASTSRSNASTASPSDSETQEIHSHIQKPVKNDWYEPVQASDTVCVSQATENAPATSLMGKTAATEKQSEEVRKDKEDN